MALRIPSLLVVILALPLAAGEVPMGAADYFPSPDRPIGWRGDGTGAYPGVRAVASFHDGPPTRVETRIRDTWNEPKTRKMPDVEDGPAKNIVWRTRLPAWAHSQPIIVGDRAFTVAEPHSLICVDMHSGEVLWDRRNSPFKFMGMGEKEVAALEDYIARVYVARVPIAARTGNYRRLPSHSPGPWKAEYLEPVLAECALAERELRELVAENPLGSKAEPALEEFLAAVEKVEALAPGDKSTKLGKELVGPFYRAVDWIEKEHGVPCLYGWDGYIGWTFATPCSDGEKVYASMGQGQVVAYDLEGNGAWGVRIPNLGKGGEPLSGRRGPRVRAKHVPSPRLAGDVLIAQAPDQLVGLDTANGRLLWADPKISVGGGYKVASHLTLKLASGRWIVVTTAGKALDAKTGEVLVDFGLGAYGSEGAGASIVGADGVAYLVASPAQRKSALVAIRFAEGADGVSAEKLWEVESPPSGQTPVLFGDHLYRFTARRREDKDVFAIADGSAVGRINPGTHGTSPSLFGDRFYTYDAGGTRERLDKRNVVPIEVVELAGPAQAGKVHGDNHLDESAPPPDRRIEEHAPDIYERIAANPEPLEWGKKKWAAAWWGNDGGVPTGFGVGGFCGTGNRVVLRTVSSLVCIGDPSQDYTWKPESRGE